MERIYAAIDLKSFYASCECRERGLSPLDTALAVADEERSDKTICLALSPYLKSYGMSGRPRLFEVKRAVKMINEKKGVAGNPSSCSESELKKDPSLSLSFIVARPRMQMYIDYSRRIYAIYLKYIAKEDIHVYSIDEVFIDLTPYLSSYRKTGQDIVKDILKDVFDETGITATAGLGTNLYLAKIAMDIYAKHKENDENGARIAQLDPISYRTLLWDHKPISDFWRVGKGYREKLERRGIYTMGDIARTSIENEDLLFSLFGVNAEILIDHAWGEESVTMRDIKNYRSEDKSISEGQVLPFPYSADKTLLVLKEMADTLSLSLTEKNLVTNQIVLSINYDKSDKRCHKSINLPYTSEAGKIRKAVSLLFKEEADTSLMVRKISLTANHVSSSLSFLDRDLFDESEKNDKEVNAQKAVLKIKKRYGKNSILKAMDLSKGATQRERNNQIGGHKA